jgi:hypothetical protein
MQDSAATIELAKRLHKPTATADAISVRVSAAAQHSQPVVQERVIRVVLTDDKIGVLVVSLVAINVVDLCALW